MTRGKAQNRKMVTRTKVNSRDNSNRSAISNARAVVERDTPLDEETWTLVVIPDTQNLAANNPTAYNSLIQWVVDNKVTEDIEMVIHLGDYVNVGSDSTQWTRTATAMDRLHTNSVPYIHCAGNHDYDDDGMGTYSRKTATYWEPTFPASDWSGKSWYVDEYDGITTNQASTLIIGTKKYLFLTIECWPRVAVITWANSIITAQNPDRIIVGTHALSRPNGTYEPDGGVLEGGGQGGDPIHYGFCDYSSTADCKSGVELYDDFISQHSNIILVCNGHDVASSDDGNGALGLTAFSKRTDTVGGNTINTHLFNYQNDSASTYQAAAVLRMYKFNHANNSCAVTTYNPVLDTSKTDGENQFTFNYS